MKGINIRETLWNKQRENTCHNWNQISGTGIDTRAKQSAFLFQNGKAKNKITQQKQLKKSILKNFKKHQGKHLYLSPLFRKPCSLQDCKFIKKIPPQVFSWKFKETFKSNFFTKNLLATAPDVASTENNSVLRKKLCRQVLF